MCPTPPGANRLLAQCLTQALCDAADDLPRGKERIDDLADVVFDRLTQHTDLPCVRIGVDFADMTTVRKCAVIGDESLAAREPRLDAGRRRHARAVMNRGRFHYLPRL